MVVRAGATSVPSETVEHDEVQNFNVPVEGDEMTVTETAWFSLSSKYVLNCVDALEAATTAYGHVAVVWNEAPYAT